MGKPDWTEKGSWPHGINQGESVKLLWFFSTPLCSRAFPGMGRNPSRRRVLLWGKEDPRMPLGKALLLPSNATHFSSRNNVLRVATVSSFTELKDWSRCWQWLHYWGRWLRPFLEHVFLWGACENSLPLSLSSCWSPRSLSVRICHPVITWRWYEWPSSLLGFCLSNFMFLIETRVM